MERVVILGALISALALGCGDAGTGTADGGGDLDGGGGIDAAVVDAALADGSAIDAAPPADDVGPRPDVGVPDGAGPPGDAGPLCAGMTRGSCSADACHCCPAGGPLERCLCTTECTSAAQCTDPARPVCNQPSPGEMGICTPMGFACAWGAVCASPDTPIATPHGARAIASLAVGDVVYSLDHGMIREVPIRAIGRQPAMGHRVVRVTLAGGAVLEMSESHPTADGRFFRDLTPGTLLDGTFVESVELVPYAHDFTYDILPDGETGTYVAGGVLVGSTLAP